MTALPEGFVRLPQSGDVIAVEAKPGRVMDVPVPCPECGGSGVAHCCEGAREGDEHAKGR